MPSSRARILIVDDSTFEQRVLADMLGEHGYHVSIAQNGRQGYDMAAAVPPDLILLDVRMPYMDGFATCRLLKANPDTLDIPVIFVSGACSEQERILGLQVGGVDYVSKPFSPAELAARVNIHLALRRRPDARSPAAGDAATQAAPAAAVAPGQPATPPHPAAAALPALPLPPAADDADAVLVAAACHLIDDNLASLPSLDDIAHQLGSYREKLSQLFRKHMGMTVFAYVRDLRLARAAQLLRDTGTGVQDIALMVGFNNAGNFATAFREYTGLPPSAYRAAQAQGTAAVAGTPASASTAASASALASASTAASADEHEDSADLH